MENKPLGLKQFITKLKHPSSLRLKEQFHQYNSCRFLGSLTEADTFMQKKMKIHNFTVQFEEILPKYPAWRNSKYSEIEEASEVLEYLITKEKYEYFILRILFAVDPFSQEQDESLARSYLRFDFIQPRHLDINPNLAEDSLIQIAGARNDLHRTKRS